MSKKEGGTVKFEVCIQALLFPFPFHLTQGLFTGYPLFNWIGMTNNQVIPSALTLY